MPCRVSSDVHEWTNEGPTVPTYNLVKPHNVDEQSTNFHRGEKTLWSFTAACCCGTVADAERSWEPSKPSLRGWWRQKCNTSHLLLYCLPRERDIGRWAVRLGRHPLENVSRGPKGRLRRVRTPPVRARPKAGLTGSLKAGDPEAKAWPSDPSCPHYWGLVVSEKLP